MNQLWTKPLPLHYATKAQRMESAVAQIAGSGSIPSVGTSRSGDDPGILAGVDQTRYQVYLEAVKKHPGDAFNSTVAGWKANDSLDLLRSMILLAKKKTTSTEESETLELMLKALDDPGAQWRECERLSRGNSLEKLIATRRTAILEENPRVNAARVADPVQAFFPLADHPQPIRWQEFRALAEGKKAIVLDARPEKIYGLGHVPGSLNLSREQFARDYAKEKPVLEADKDRAVAVYCNGLDCDDSKMVAGAFVKLGYRRVLIFKGGWTEWTFQHLPQEAKR